MLVDTGSYGVRVFASQIPSLALPFEASSTNNPLATCAVFVDSVMWGPVELADVIVADEVASNIPVHVVGDDPAFPIPTGCSNRLPPNSPGPLVSPQDLPVDGILGIGSFREDCGPACALDISDKRNPGLYFDCPSSGCTETSADVLAQVQNPVWTFPTDNNGIILQLPPVPGHDAPSLTGSLIFGIGTQANNGMGSATVFPLDDSGDLDTVYNNTRQLGYLDTGSNGLFFGTPTGSLPECTNVSGFYCPTLGKNLSASIQGVGTGAPTRTINFTILNAETLFSDPNNFVFDNVGGPNPPANSGDTPVFVWGLPFFFGRNVYYSIDGQTTPQGTGLFVAF